MGKRGRNKPHDRQVKHSKAAHHSLTNAQLVPGQWSAPPSQLPAVHVQIMTLYSMEYPFDQFGSAVLAMLPHSSSLAEHKAPKSPVSTFRVSTI